MTLPWQCHFQIFFSHRFPSVEVWLVRFRRIISSHLVRPDNGSFSIRWMPRFAEVLVLCTVKTSFHGYNQSFKAGFAKSSFHSHRNDSFGHLPRSRFSTSRVCPPEGTCSFGSISEEIKPRESMDAYLSLALQGLDRSFPSVQCTYHPP